uniref:Uncharacterized protein n=1 Tax=Trichogramma kaykai TaxID=54128 RepID=A0ABD2WSF3_9HYME
MYKCVGTVNGNSEHSGALAEIMYTPRITISAWRMKETNCKPVAKEVTAGTTARYTRNYRIGNDDDKAI